MGCTLFTEVMLAALQLRAKDVEIGLLRASPSRLALMRSWDVAIQQIGVSFKVNGSAGVTYQGAHGVGTHACIGSTKTLSICSLHTLASAPECFASAPERFSSQA